MRLFRTLGALLPVTALALVVAGCANQAPDASSRPSGPASSLSAPRTTTATDGLRPRSSGHKERIRPAGIAAVVQEHLGADRVRSYGSYGDEPGSVELMVDLRSADRRDMFVVSVYSPDQTGGEFDVLRRCHHDKKSTKFMRHKTCHRLTDGTTVLAYLSEGGFSDDNVHGSVVTGTSRSPDASVAIAMYESYDPSPAVTVADLDRLLSDRRLRWRTDSAVNDAGRDLDVRTLNG